MVKRHVILLATLIGGCALIDASSGPDDGEPIIIETNNSTPAFTPAVCVWANCPCAQTGCDPADCLATACVTCTLDAHCSTGDVCQPNGRCAVCETGQFTAPDYYVAPGGVEYVCEYDPFDFNQFCIRPSCFPEQW